MRRKCDDDDGHFFFFLIFQPDGGTKEDGARWAGEANEFFFCFSVLVVFFSLSLYNLYIFTIRNIY
jgi:hypothetical protein